MASLAIVATTQAEESAPTDLANPPEVVTLSQLAKLPPHPRLLANATRWRELREQVKTDADTAMIFKLLRGRAKSMLALPPVDYTADPHNILIAVREAERRILTFAVVYRLTDNPTWLEAARSVIQDLIAQPWPRGHFLDTAEATFSLSAGLDWLYDSLTPAERAAIIEKIHREALLASVTEEEKMGWIWADHNWNQVCNSGLVTGALVTTERDPALAKRIINRSIANLPRAAAAYAPAGVYPEGPSYWSYGTTYHVIQIEALRSALGSSTGLESFPGFLQSAASLDFLTGPTGEFFNHADNHKKRSYSAAALWFARENQRPDLARAELERVQQFAAQVEEEDNRELPLLLLWWRALPESLPKVPADPLNWRGESIQPIAVLRSSWSDPLATWLAIKGGTAHHSHAHMDAGSFVLEALGVRWALDPVRDNYSFLRAAGYKQEEIFNYVQDSKRWKVFRLGPEGHNILRFNGAPQNVDGHAAVGPIRESTDGATVELDLSPSYAGQVASAHRSATLRPDASIVLTDTWTTLEKPVEVTWQWLTRAVVTPEPGGVRLEQDGKGLRLRVEGDNPRVDIQQASSLLDPKIDSPLPEHTRITISISSPANATASLRVTAVPDKAP